MTTKTTTYARALLTAAFALFTALVPACDPAASEDSAADSQADSVRAMQQSLVTATGVRVQATYRELITGTPTYGDPATSPVLLVHVEVDDAALRALYPSFDGMERVFVRVPKSSPRGLTWENVPLRYSGQRRTGYYGTIVIDLHDSGSIWNVDFATLSANGVAIGLESNLGVIWAQEEGKNHPVLRG